MSLLLMKKGVVALFVGEAAGDLLRKYSSVYNTRKNTSSSVHRYGILSMSEFT